LTHPGNKTATQLLREVRERCESIRGIEATDKGMSTAATLDQKRKRIPTFAGFIDEYSDWLDDDPGHIHASVTIARLKASFSGDPLWSRRLNEVMHGDVARHEHRRLKVAQPAAVRREVGDLKSMLTRHEEFEGKNTGFSNPLTGYKPRSKVDKGKPGRRAFTEDEITALLAALDEREQEKRDARDRFNVHRSER